VGPSSLLPTEAFRERKRNGHWLPLLTKDFFCKRHLQKASTFCLQPVCLPGLVAHTPCATSLVTLGTLCMSSPPPALKGGDFPRVLQPHDRQEIIWTRVQRTEAFKHTH